MARDDLRRGRQADQDGARRGLARDVDVHVCRGRGAQARRRDRPDGRVGGRRREDRVHAAPADRRRSARSRRSTSRATSSRTSSLRRSPPAARSCSSRRAPTPLSALLLAELEHEAGLPDGWLTVLVGPSAEIGDVLVERRARPDDHVHRLERRRLGHRRARAAKKRVRLELGNSTPVVVAADADLDLAATKLAANAFSFAGQSCISVQRIYVSGRPSTASWSGSCPRSRRWWSATLRTRRPTSGR